VRSAALLAAAAAALALGSVAHAGPGRIAVGLEAGASVDAVAALAEAATGGSVARDLDALDAIVVSVADVDLALPVLSELSGVSYVEEIVPGGRRLAFVPNDPLLVFQWYLTSIRAFDYWDAAPPVLDPVLVAVIDSGIAASHPEFQGKIAGMRSFVNGPADVDTIGHGTMVAGEIAAAIDNSEGIAGAGFPVQLLIAKVVSPGGGISVEAEAKAIRWAVDRGARVINLSLGGHRDPTNSAADTYSALEQAAIEYAYSRGRVIVAATGNCPKACPYKYASYPAALAHVIGTSALTVDHRTPSFSNRDTVFNDIAAPGADIVSTFPFDLTDPACEFPGYSMCALGNLRSGEGTSFAAPLVSAAAAVLIAQRSTLGASQVIELIENSATDLLSPGRDASTGHGLVNIHGALSALQEPLPQPDRFETNDDAGGGAYRLFGGGRTVSATIDYFDDPRDVYRVVLKARQRLELRLSGPAGGRPTLVVWRPGTEHVTDVTALAVRSGSVVAFRTAANPRLNYVAPRSGAYFVEVKAPKRGGGAYDLTLQKR
jgi:hypothetical protein